MAFELLRLGPILSFDSKESLKTHCKDILDQGYVPILTMNKGSFFEMLKATSPPQVRETIKGILITHYYSEFYGA